jgi:hypothetical protein
VNVRINVEYEVEVPVRNEAASRPPLIPVCGFWLSEYGFHRGTAVRVFAKYGEIRLILEEGGAVGEAGREEPAKRAGHRHPASLGLCYHSA